MPTIEQWLELTTRAASLGYRVLIVAGSHVEMLSAATGRAVARVEAWGEVGEWLDACEQQEWRQAA